MEDARPELPEPLAILLGEYRLRREVEFLFVVRDETSFSSKWVDDRKKFTTRCGILPTLKFLANGGEAVRWLKGWPGPDRLTTPQRRTQCLVRSVGNHINAPRTTQIRHPQFDPD